MTRHEKAWATRRQKHGSSGFANHAGNPGYRAFGNPEKTWATRRAKYGPGGGNSTPSKLHWVKDRRRYDCLRRMYGAELAKQIIALEQADASA